MLSCALYEVTTRPEYIRPLRDEVEEMLSQDGWTKEGISKLHKMDSFFKEIHRCYDLNICTRQFGCLLAVDTDLSRGPLSWILQCILVDAP